MPASWAEAAPQAAFELQQTPDGLALRAVHRRDWEPLVLDWTSTEIRRRVAAGRRQLLPRALGLHKKPGLRIVDATAGLGRDGFTLAALGAEVTLIERQPLVAALLRDALRRALDAPSTHQAAQRIRIVEADAQAWLSRPDQPIDAIHLDPMYPDDGKTALPQKAMQMLRALGGGDTDAQMLLAAALASAARRVAVKRAIGADWLGGVRPDLHLKGTQARYDIYLLSI